ncbi:hypothetical protein Gorai_020017, partial [Gossypium raimondii]|nr:hypothetical protein [Gossypium raimondii]
MAEEALRRLEDYFWVEDAPLKAFDLAASDLNLLPNVSVRGEGLTAIWFLLRRHLAQIE